MYVSWILVWLHTIGQDVRSVILLDAITFLLMFLLWHCLLALGGGAFKLYFSIELVQDSLDYGRHHGCSGCVADPHG